MCFWKGGVERTKEVGTTSGFSSVFIYSVHKRISVGREGEAKR